MRIEILNLAVEDLIDGYRFYESQSQGIGDYFLNSIFSDIESLHLYAGIHTLYFGYHRLFAKRFPFVIPARTTDESRYLLIGKISERYWSAIFTYRGETIRLISVRRSRKEEIELYES